jgi:4-carboxymuconolactone decarboxylase
MSEIRLPPPPSRSLGPLAKATLALARRKTRQMAGRAPDGMIGPFETLARAPRLLVSYGLFEAAIASQHRVPERLKALAELKAATMTTCEYCIDIGSSIARSSGVTDEELLALPRYRDSDVFDEREKLVMDYAVAMSRTPVEVSDELFARLRTFLDERQLVELTQVIALENMRGRFNHALGFGAAGFSEGMVCAVPDTPAGIAAAGQPVAGAA